MPYDYSSFDKPPDEKKDSNLSTEEQAQAMGWRPRKEFKGEPDDWVEAKVFLRNNFRRKGNPRKQMAKKVEASRINGAKGGRPKKKKLKTQRS